MVCKSSFRLADLMLVNGLASESVVGYEYEDDVSVLMDPVTDC
jgi:hypothetical protein